MNTMELVHLVSTDERAGRRSSGTSAPAFYSELIRPARQAILRARQHLLSKQRSNGLWLATQKTDAALASQLILMLAHLERNDSALAEQAVATILEQQLPNGGWPLVPDGAADLSTSVQAYFALKLSGLEANDERLSRARDTIRRLGGADAADTPTRFFLALLGQVAYDCCPAVPPEWFLWIGQQDRRTAALAAIWSHRPVRQLDAEGGVRELFIRHPSHWMTPLSLEPERVWAAASIPASILRLCERIGWTPLRAHALSRVQSQLRQDIDAEQIGQLDFCELLWHAIALHAMGYRDDSPQCQSCDERLRDMLQLDDDLLLAWPRLRSAPVTDTIAALQSLGASGVTATHPSIAAAVQWLSDRRHSGPAPSVTELAGLLELLSAGTDCEDAADEALPPAIDLRRNGRGSYRSCRFNHRARIARVASPIVERLLRLQNADGGWASCGRESTPDATSAVLQALGDHHSAMVSAAERRAVDSLRRAQRPDGSWDSARGVRLIHGTSSAVRGLLAAGVSCDDEAVAAGANWLLVHQQPSGGWGELPSECVRDGTDEFADGEATASQTAWAILALVTAGGANTAAVRRAIDFLLETQQEDGQWHEPQFVLRDAAAGRWFQSDVHAVAGPLLALSRWAVAATNEHWNGSEPVSLRLVGATAD